MKARNQALLLEEMMQNQKKEPGFSLILPPFLVKKKYLHSLSSGDVLLLGLNTLKLYLIPNNTLPHITKFAKLTWSKEDKEKLSITSICNTNLTPIHDSAYEKVICILTKIDISQFKIGTTIKLNDKMFKSVEVFNLNHAIRAKGKLIEVEGKIAVEIIRKK